MNKKDLFEKKITKFSIKSIFPEFDKENTYEETSEYIREQFEKFNQTPEERSIFTHFTCGVDSENINFVFTSVCDGIVQTRLKMYGLYW